jgi:hypothetical protein
LEQPKRKRRPKKVATDECCAPPSVDSVPISQSIPFKALGIPTLRSIWETSAIIITTQLEARSPDSSPQMPAQLDDSPVLPLLTVEDECQLSNEFDIAADFLFNDNNDSVSQTLNSILYEDMADYSMKQSLSRVRAKLLKAYSEEETNDIMIASKENVVQLLIY